MRERLLNAAILFVTVAVFSTMGWFVSIGLYWLGLWPLGAIVRILVFMFALYGLWWVLRHLFESPEARLRRDIETMRRRGQP